MCACVSACACVRVSVGWTRKRRFYNIYYNYAISCFALFLGNSKTTKCHPPISVYSFFYFFDSARFALYVAFGNFKEDKIKTLNSLCFNFRNHAQLLLYFMVLLNCNFVVAWNGIEMVYVGCVCLTKSTHVYAGECRFF